MTSPPLYLLLEACGLLVLVVAVSIHRTIQRARGKKFHPSIRRVPPPRVAALFGIVCSVVGWFYPHTPVNYNQPVQATIIEKAISKHIRHGRSTSTEYRPYLIVQYKIQEHKYESNCRIGTTNVLDQIVGTDYEVYPEQAEKLLSPYAVGSKITVYYAADAPHSVSVNAELHVGGRCLLFLGVLFLFLALLGLMFPSLTRDPEQSGNDLSANEDRIATDGHTWLKSL